MLELYHGTPLGVRPESAAAVGRKAAGMGKPHEALNGDQLDPDYLKLNPNGAARLALLRTNVYSGLSTLQPSQHKR